MPRDSFIARHAAAIDAAWPDRITPVELYVMHEVPPLPVPSLHPPVPPLPLPVPVPLPVPPLHVCLCHPGLYCLCHQEATQLPASFPPEDVPDGWPLAPAPLVSADTPSLLRDLAASAHAAVAQGGAAAVAPPMLW